MSYQISEDADGDLTIVVSEDGNVQEFQQFKDDISIGCLLMEHKKDYEFNNGVWQNNDVINCRGVLPANCIEVSTIEQILMSGYNGEDLSLDEVVKFRAKQSENRPSLSTAEAYHQLIDNNQNIAVCLVPSDDDNKNSASLSYYPWAIYALQGRADFMRHIDLTVSLPVEIFTEIKNSILNGEPIDRFIITIKPKVLKISFHSPEETAAANALFCQKFNDSYALLFNGDTGIQHCEVSSIYYQTDPLEIKKTTIINEFGSWKDEAIPPIQTVANEIIKLREILESEVKKQVTINTLIRDMVENSKKRWWEK